MPRISSILFFISFAGVMNFSVAIITQEGQYSVFQQVGLGLGLGLIVSVMIMAVVLHYRWRSDRENWGRRNYMLSDK